MVDLLVWLWLLKQPAEYYKVERDIMVIKFMSKEDQEKVLDSGPSTFKGNAIILQRWESGMTDDDFEDNKINIWVREHRLLYELPKVMRKSLLVMLERSE